MSRPPRCPTPSKTAFASEQHALYAWEKIRGHNVLNPDMQRPLYTYRCACRKWHLTRRPQ